MDNYAQIYTALLSGKAHNDMKFRIAATKKIRRASRSDV